MKLLGKIVFAIICLIGITGYGRELYQLIYSFFSTPRLTLSFLSGLIIYLLMSVFIFKQRGEFWNILEHELTHALFALLFFKRVDSLSTKRDYGGEVVVHGSNFIITLSPYFFPLFTVLILFIKPFMFTNIQWVLNFLLGFTLMFHLLHLFREFHISQPDIRRSGFIFSMIVVLFFNIVFIGLCLVSLKGGWREMGMFLSGGFQNSKIFAKEGWLLIEQSIFPFLKKIFNQHIMGSS
ncbi:MAG: hypothetical protein D6748_04920 [Calditrichaeota bacterium]|nr:MAG: hypothetical protein D6748_04920 [Calditrichota bacterium]